MTTKAFWQLGNLYTGKELVMGLPSSVIFASGRWQGFLMDEVRAHELVSLIEGHADWRPRQEAEQDKNWQQIYPYGIFSCGDLYSEFKRGTTASHARMSMKYTMAVGGHVIKEEFAKHGSLANWLVQIFNQDIEYVGQVTPKLIGVLNDNSEDLGRYHVGIVYLLEGNMPELKSRIHTEVRLVKLKDMTGQDVEFLERWSQMVYRRLRDKELALAAGEESRFHVKHLMGG